MARTRPRSRRSSAAKAGMAVVVVGQAVERRVRVDDGGEQPCRRLAARVKARRRRRDVLRCVPALDFAMRGWPARRLTTTGPWARSDCGPRCASAPRRAPAAALRCGPTVRHGPCGAARSSPGSPAQPAAALRSHRLQRRDAVLGGGMGGEQIVHALAGQRVDDEQMRGRRIALGIRVRDAAARARDLAERRGEPQRLAADLGAARGRPHIRACG